MVNTSDRGGGDLKRRIKLFLKKNAIKIGIGAGIAVGAPIIGAVAVVGAPVVLGAAGFTSGGIAAGSLAASMMSSAAIANGGGIAAGSLVAVLQSAGAVGLSAATTAGVAGAGAAVGGAVGGGIGAGVARALDDAEQEEQHRDGNGQEPMKCEKCCQRDCTLLLLPCHHLCCTSCVNMPESQAEKCPCCNTVIIRKMKVDN